MAWLTGSTAVCGFGLGIRQLLEDFTQYIGDFVGECVSIHGAAKQLRVDMEADARCHRERDSLTARKDDLDSLRRQALLTEQRVATDRPDMIVAIVGVCSASRRCWYEAFSDHVADLSLWDARQFRERANIHARPFRQ